MSLPIVTRAHKIVFLAAVLVGLLAAVPVVLANCPGPDGDGYTCGDVPVNFVDISGTGTDLNLGDDQGAVVSIGFTFNYRGTDYSDVGVSSNGYLDFGPGYDLTDSTPDGVPSADDPDGWVGAWNDYNPAYGGAVYVQNAGASPFIAQWNDVPYYLAHGSNTFQVQLYEGTNEIEVHFASMTDTSTTTVLGSENEAGTTGLQADFGDDEASLSNTATCFAPAGSSCGAPAPPKAPEPEILPRGPCDGNPWKYNDVGGHWERDLYYFCYNDDMQIIWDQLGSGCNWEEFQAHLASLGFSTDYNESVTQLVEAGYVLEWGGVNEDKPFPKPACFSMGAPMAP